MTEVPKSPVLIEKSEWYIAAIFFVIAGLFVPTIVGYVLMTIYMSGGSEYLTGSGLNLGLLMTCAAIYFSALYVARHIKNRYVILLPKRIALIATGYFLATMGPWLLYQTWTYTNGIEEAAPLLIGFRLLTTCIFATTLYGAVKRSLA